jgi:hypothetical protein
MLKNHPQIVDRDGGVHYHHLPDGVEGDVLGHVFPCLQGEHFWPVQSKLTPSDKKKKESV